MCSHQLNIPGAERNLEMYAFCIHPSKAVSSPKPQVLHPPSSSFLYPNQPRYSINVPVPSRHRLGLIPQDSRQCTILLGIMSEFPDQKCHLLPLTPKSPWLAFSYALILCFELKLIPPLFICKFLKVPGQTFSLLESLTQSTVFYLWSSFHKCSENGTSPKSLPQEHNTFKSPQEFLSLTWEGISFERGHKRNV